MGWCFLLIGLAATGYGVYVPTNELDVRVSASRVKRIRRWFGLVLQEQSWSPREIVTVEIDQSGYMNYGNKTTVFHTVAARSRRKRKFLLAEGITDRTMAESVRDLVLEQCGLRAAR